MLYHKTDLKYAACRMIMALPENDFVELFRADISLCHLPTLVTAN